MITETDEDNQEKAASESTEAFLDLSWEGNETADEIIAGIRKERKNSNWSRITSCISQESPGCIYGNGY